MARVITARAVGQEPPPFRYKDLGELATIGRLRGVADLRRVRFHGFVAWLLWLSIHLFWLVGLHNRILVFIRWTWSFFTRGRANRLITGEGYALTSAASVAEEDDGRGGAHETPSVGEAHVPADAEETDPLTVRAPIHDGE